MRWPLILSLALLAGCGAEQRPPQATQAERLNAAGSDALQSGRARAAAARFSAAADASRSVDDRDGLARDLHNRGMALLAAGDAASAAADLDQSARIADQAGSEPHDRARTRLALVMALTRLGRLDDATEALRAASLAADEDGDSSLRARVRTSRAALALRRGDLDAAQAELDAAEPMCGEDQGARGAVAVNRGHLLTRRGDVIGAMAAYDAAATAFRRCADQAGIAAALTGAAQACEATGDRAGAAERWRRAALIPSGGTAAQAQRNAEADRLERP